MVGIKIMPDATVILIDVEISNMVNIIGGEYTVYSFVDCCIFFNTTILHRRFNRLATKLTGNEFNIFGYAFICQRDGDKLIDADAGFLEKMKEKMKKLEDAVFVDLRRIKNEPLRNKR